MPFDGVLYYAWVIPGAIAVTVCCLSFFRFWSQLPPRTRRGLFLGAAVYVTGALGFELLAGHYTTLHGYRSMPFSLAAQAEELLELTGLTLLIHTFLTHLRDALGVRELRLNC
jgi:hypothetical protein